VKSLLHLFLWGEAYLSVAKPISSGRSRFNWGFSVFNDHTLKPVAPKITTPVVAFYVIYTMLNDDIFRIISARPITRHEGNNMKSNNLKKRLQKSRPMDLIWAITISWRISVRPSHLLNFSSSIFSLAAGDPIHFFNPCESV